MKCLAVLTGVGLCLSACSPAPVPEVSPAVQTEIRNLHEELDLLEKQEEVQLQELLAEQEALTLSNQVLQAEVESMQAAISRMESERIAPTPQPPTPPAENGLDEVTLTNGSSFAAEVKEIRGDQVKLVRDGQEQDGPLSVIDEIRFRSVPPASP